ncbi:MAG: PP2C family protein-serine/threonine phosphatase, partial [Thermoanaerobaculia bacterium]
TRQQTTWVISIFILVFRFLGFAVLGLMSWSVGESFCRELWPQKLASIDALFRLRWANATVARSSLRGFASGLAMAGVLVALATTAQDRGAWAASVFIFDASLSGPLPALAALAGGLTAFVPLYLFIALLLPCWATRRLGSVGGLAVAILASIFLVPMVLVLPIHWGWAMWAAVAAVPVLLFRFGDLLSALLSILVAGVTIALCPAFFADSAAIQMQGLAALLVAAAPVIVSLRHLGGGQEFVYAYDDVPPHVRRIAERERQRVELETARNIQASILPALPPQLNGVEIAHTYLPATEVGGDFYDVLALDDGRLAVAVGDVAGHGVSSGLVMSMAKSALAVQVSFDPAVESVMSTLNRMVYQSARRRLLSTLCYAILDPRQKELYYASAGHVFPYRVSPGGDVEALQAESYPLGVRADIDVRVRTSKLEAGDAVFMYSDGLVEATAENDDEAFGFERLEDSLRRHASKPPAAMRDAVLEDVRRYTGARPLEDDLTVLVLRLPAA